jgi:hypothetical protein
MQIRLISKKDRLLTKAAVFFNQLETLNNFRFNFKYGS